jgi:hypothetical protein
MHKLTLLFKLLKGVFTSSPTFLRLGILRGVPHLRHLLMARPPSNVIGYPGGKYMPLMNLAGSLPVAFCMSTPKLPAAAAPSEAHVAVQLASSFTFQHLNFCVLFNCTAVFCSCRHPAAGEAVCTERRSCRRGPVWPQGVLVCAQHQRRGGHALPDEQAVQGRPLWH